MPKRDKTPRWQRVLNRLFGKNWEGSKHSRQRRPVHVTAAQARRTRREKKRRRRQSWSRRAKATLARRIK